MKTKNLFFTLSLVIICGTFKMLAQASPYNVALGTVAGSNLRGAAPGSQGNTAIGDESMYLTTLPNLTGSSNTAIGASSLLSNTSGSSNCAVGLESLRANTAGSNNVGVGYWALRSNTVGIQNTAIGDHSFYQCNGTTSPAGNGNVGLGYNSGQSCTIGYNNTFLGPNSGQNITIGYGNSFVGPVTVPGLTASTSTSSGYDTNNTVILATSDSGFLQKQRLYIHSNGYAGFGLGNNSIPQNSLEIGGIPVTGTLGLRFRGTSNTNFTATATSSKRVLSVNSVGDVILVDDIGGGITQSCSTANFVPINSATAGVLGCSQIFDNGTSVGISTTGTFAYTVNTGAGDFSAGVVASPGTAKLKVNGVTWATGFYASSDKKFKKDIKSIENPLETIQKIDGKTYLWSKEANKEMNFDSGLHSGFIAQELEKVLPHLVATSADGSKAVNYMELMPYLVEAIKEQQTQINDLKAQISENFKAQNQDLIAFTNTKIISVSPNPSRDVIAVSLNVEKGIENASLEVFDLNGKMLSNLSIKERETNINKTLQKPTIWMCGL